VGEGEGEQDGTGAEDLAEPPVRSLVQTQSHTHTHTHTHANIHTHTHTHTHTRARGQTHGTRREQGGFERGAMGVGGRRVCVGGAEWGHLGVGWWWWWWW
jgi:hypothetical protein